jgi:ribonuclease R
VRELARALQIDGARLPALRELLGRLEEQGLVYRHRKGAYATPDRLGLAVGRLQVIRSGDAFVVTGPSEPDVFIRSHHRKSAVEGDRVVARIERRRRRNPEGRVIRVLERAFQQIVGVYHRRKAYGVVVPQEPRLSIELFVPADLTADASDGDLVLVEIVDWGEKEPSPVSRVKQVLGRPDDPGVDVLAILLGHQLPLEFPAEVEDAAELVARRGISDADLDGRTDLRDRLVFTIDPADAKDHDDALSIHPMHNGRFEVGVHIADVSFYVEEGSTLDSEARERGTSVYLVDRVVPMLPHALSSGLCSLVPDEDRLTLSVLYDVDGSGNVGGSRIVRSVIRSAHRLSYDDAQALLDGDRHPEPESAELVDALHRLRNVSRRLRAARKARGSIDFDLPEARVVLGASGEPEDVQRVLRLESHLLVEDLMIQANETVAELAQEAGLPSIYRVHEPPTEPGVEGLRDLAATFGHQLPAGSLKPSAIAALLDAMRGRPQEQLVSTVALRSMQQARYATENLGHFGLASTAYLHFTSPIRRYPDLVVHRETVRWLEAGSRQPGVAAAASRTDPERLALIADHASERERRAMAAERDSVDLKKIQFMERHLGDEFAGTISGVTRFGLFVLLDDYHVDGLIHVSTLRDDYFRFVESRHALVGRRSRRQLTLGDPVRVQVVRVDRERRRIDFELA